MGGKGRMFKGKKCPPRAMAMSEHNCMSTVVTSDDSFTETSASPL